MPGYVDVFSASNLYTSELTYTALSLAANTQLRWPLEAAEGGTPVAKIVDLTANAAWELTLPNAAEASTGETILFNNLSAYALIVRDYAGTQVASLPTGTQQQLYLADNSTPAGGWRAYQLGASVAAADASALAGNGLVAVGAKLFQSADTVSFTAGFTVTTSQAAQFLNFVGSVGSQTVTLPNAATAGHTWFIRLRNSGSATFTLAAPAGQTINGQSSISFNIDDSALIASDGASAFYTVGLGQDATFAFDYTTIDVSGGTDYTLTGSELNRIAYEFTGTLTANVSVIVPATVQQYWVANSTTGGGLSLKTATQVTPAALPDSGRSIYYCDGSNVVPAVTATAIVMSVSGGMF
jgi:hypothetical protein